MCDGPFVQDREVLCIPSRRRNPIIVDAFNRLRLMERRDSGFKKICSDYDSFVLALSNLNYNVYVIVK